MIVDFVPFFVLLTIYDALHGAAGHWFLPHAIPQIKIDEWLFGGTVPTVSLQHAFYTPGVAHPWDYAAFAVYMTHFILPFVVAGVLWRFDHERFRRWAALFVGLTFAAFLTYAIYPAVPPWMASQSAHLQPTAKIIDEMWAHVGFAQRIGHLLGHRPLRQPGRGSTVAARGVPDALSPCSSGRSGGRWRPLLVLYPLAMAFTLVYTGEHYVIDIVAGVPVRDGGVRRRVTATGPLGPRPTSVPVLGDRPDAALTRYRRRRLSSRGWRSFRRTSSCGTTARARPGAATPIAPVRSAPVRSAPTRSARWRSAALRSA